MILFYFSGCSGLMIVSKFPFNGTQSFNAYEKTGDPIKKWDTGEAYQNKGVLSIRIVPMNNVTVRVSIMETYPKLLLV